MLERRGSVRVCGGTREVAKLKASLHSTGTGPDLPKAEKCRDGFFCFSLLSYSLFLVFSLLL